MLSPCHSVGPCATIPYTLLQRLTFQTKLAAQFRGIVCTRLVALLAISGSRNSRRQGCNGVQVPVYEDSTALLILKQGVERNLASCAACNIANVPRIQLLAGFAKLPEQMDKQADISQRIMQHCQTQTMTGSTTLFKNL